VRGFTLFELLIVLALMALVGAVVVPALGNRSGAGLEVAARLLQAGLRQARSRAMIRNRPVALTVDLAKGRLGVAEDHRYRSLPPGLVYTLVTARTEQVDERVGRVRFFPDGSSTGGRITVAAGERRRIVDIDWFTGRVRVLDGRDYRVPARTGGPVGRAL